MSPEEKNTQIIADMIAMAKADHNLDTREYDFIVAVADRLHISEKQVQDLVDHPIATLTFKTELERITQFHRLVLVMHIDNHSHESEIVAIRNYGLRHGIRQEAITQILEEMQEYEHKIIPAQRLVEIFKRFYN